jgi:hypothetical protein
VRDAGGLEPEGELDVRGAADSIGRGGRVTELHVRPEEILADHFQTQVIGRAPGDRGFDSGIAPLAVKYQSCHARFARRCPCSAPS